MNKDKIVRMEKVFQFNITGDGGGEWNVKIANDTVEVGEGKSESPNITLTATSQDWLDIVSGKLNGQTAFLTGKLKIQGDMTLAMKLATVFSFG
ncbi:MAG TPA: SCP2 sterol-binding domain-containing protein [Candidatus Hydrogenedentes bacterium]|nr:SCP2 sterol-binding domain-containing protein [Candidatus Hydrogenedentota bacterium]